MRLFGIRKSAGRSEELWPVLLLLLVVAVPTIAVLWFVGVAVENQQLAAKQRLTDAYRSNLQTVRAELLRQWRDLEQGIALHARQGNTPRAKFQAILSHVDNLSSIVCLDQDGQLEYPEMQTSLADATIVNQRWVEAQRLENANQSWDKAAERYRQLKEEATSQINFALALQGEVRCRFRMAEPEEATKLVVDLSDQQIERLSPKGQVDPRANHVIARVELLVAETAAQRGQEVNVIWDRLHQRVFADSDVLLPGPQRLFIMRRMTELHPNERDLQWLQAEDLAANYAIATAPVQGFAQQSESTALQASPLPNIWYRVTADGQYICLFDSDAIRSRVGPACGAVALPKGVQVQLLAPLEDAASAIPEALSLTVGEAMPGWRLSLLPQTDQTADGLESGRIHMWTATLVLLFTALLGIVIVRAFRQKLRLARLKNDLVGTVSHELKTPLASMRLLVETLLDETAFDPQKTREYLQLIDRENVRLSRLIENFLTFSKMERGAHKLQLEDVRVDEIISMAVEAMGDRLQEPNCKFCVTVPADLPTLWADRDALVTAVLNLLDNAHKYSGQDRPRDIAVSVKRNRNQILLQVSDNGIGLPRTATKRVFDRFFQVDQSLRRRSQGCGLGLSIVASIVREHNGEVSVESELGTGSTFRLTLPVDSGKQHGDNDVKT